MKGLSPQPQARRALAHAVPFLFTAGSFLVSLTSAVLMKIMPDAAQELPRSESSQPKGPGPKGNMLAGVRVLWDRPVLRAATLLIMFMNTIGAGLDLFKLQNGRYPTTSEGLGALVGGAGYLKGGKVPQDPWGRDYLYASPGQHGEADVWSLGADGKDGGEDANADIGSWQD